MAPSKPGSLRAAWILALGRSPPSLSSQVREHSLLPRENVYRGNVLPENFWFIYRFLSSFEIKISARGNAAGSLRVGDHVVAGSQYGRVRVLRSPSGTPHHSMQALVMSSGTPLSSGSMTGGSATPLPVLAPGEAAEVAGLRGLPRAGDELVTCSSEEYARRLATARRREGVF